MLKFVYRAVLALVVAATGLVLAPSPAMAATVGPVYIWSYAAQKCIDNPNSAPGNNVVMIIYTCQRDRAANQSWTWKSTDSGYWNIQNGASGRCLAVKNAWLGDQVDVLQFDCNNGNNEEWYTVKTNYSVEWGWRADYYLIKNRNSNKCLAIKSDSVSNGAKLVQDECNGGAHQVWSWAPDLRLHG